MAHDDDDIVEDNSPDEILETDRMTETHSIYADNDDDTEDPDESSDINDSPDASADDVEDDIPLDHPTTDSDVDEDERYQEGTTAASSGVDS